MKIAVDLGHGVNPDRGAVGIIPEENAINEIGRIVINKLRSLGHDVLEVRPSSASSVSNSLAQRYNTANNWGANIFVSFHDNAGRGLGSEVFTYQTQNLPEAQRWLSKMSALGFRNRGIKDGSRLAVINGTTMKALLFEGFFVDRQEDVDLYNRLDKEKISNAYVYAITGTDLDTQQKPVETRQDFNIYMKCHGSNIGDMSTSGVNECEINPDQGRQIEMFALDIDKVDFTIQAHIQNLGDTQEYPKGFFLGSFHQSRRLEAIKINVRSIPDGYKLMYQVFVFGNGWTNWCESSQWCGTKGESKAIGHIKVKIVKK